MLRVAQRQSGRVRDPLISAAEISGTTGISPGIAGRIHSANLAKMPFTQPTRQRGGALVSQPYVDGITDTVTHDIATTLTAGQITAAQDGFSISVVCADRWFPGDAAVVTSRDGRVFTGEVERMDVCTGEITIKLSGG